MDYAVLKARAKIKIPTSASRDSFDVALDPTYFTSREGRLLENYSSAIQVLGEIGSDFVDCKYRSKALHNFIEKGAQSYGRESVLFSKVYPNVGGIRQITIAEYIINTVGSHVFGVTAKDMTIILKEVDKTLITYLKHQGCNLESILQKSLVGACKNLKTTIGHVDKVLDKVGLEQLTIVAPDNIVTPIKDFEKSNFYSTMSKYLKSPTVTKGDVGELTKGLKLFGMINTIHDVFREGGMFTFGEELLFAKQHADSPLSKPVIDALGDYYNDGEVMHTSNIFRQNYILSSSVAKEIMNDTGVEREQLIGLVGRNGVGGLEGKLESYLVKMYKKSPLGIKITGIKEPTMDLF